MNVKVELAHQNCNWNVLIHKYQNMDVKKLNYFDNRGIIPSLPTIHDVNTNITYCFYQIARKIFYASELDKIYPKDKAYSFYQVPNSQYYGEEQFYVDDYCYYYGFVSFLRSPTCRDTITEAAFIHMGTPEEFGKTIYGIKTALQNMRDNFGIRKIQFSASEGSDMSRFWKGLDCERLFGTVVKSIRCVGYLTDADISLDGKRHNRNLFEAIL